MTDIHFEYKSALHRAHARHAAEKEGEERRIKKGRTAFTEEAYAERLQYFLSRIPINYTRCDMRASPDTLVT